MMVLSKRLKVLSVLAAGIGIYIVVSGPDASTSAVTAAGSAATRTANAPATGVARSAARPGSADSDRLLARLAHRVASSKTIDSLFHTQSWYVAPPAPPPAPAVLAAPPPPTAPPLPFTVHGR